MKAQESKNKDKLAMWGQRLKAAQEFPGSMRQYCAANSISYARLQYWRSKIDGNAEVRQASSSPFVRVEQDAAGAPLRRGEALTVSPGARFVAEVLWHMAMMGQGGQP
jgi:hypothetical protein